MLCFDLVIIFLVCIRFRKSGAGGVTHLSPSSDDLNLENLKDVINWILIGSDGLQIIPGSTQIKMQMEKRVCCRGEDRTLMLCSISA